MGVMAEPRGVLPWGEAEKLNLARAWVSSCPAWRGSTQVSPGSSWVHS